MQTDVDQTLTPPLLWFLPPRFAIPSGMGRDVVGCLFLGSGPEGPGGLCVGAEGGGGKGSHTPFN